MRTSVDLPPPLFQDLKANAVKRGVTMKSLIITAIEKELAGGHQPGYRIRSPLIPRKGRHTIRLTNAEIEELLA